MSFEVNREPVDDVIGDVTSILRATRSIEIDDARMDWLYRNNPDGSAVLWSIRKSDTGEMAGFTVCLPRRMLVGGEQKLAWNGADFSILPKYRALGVALKLRRAAKTEIDQGAADLLYSHPNEKMQLIHERVGHSRVGMMQRYAKPLRIANRLSSKIPDAVAGVIDASIGRVVTSSKAGWLHRYQHQMTVEEAKFGDEFDRLFDRIGAQRTFLGVRDSRYLDWRYRQYPNVSFQVICARDGDQLEGYLILMRQSEAAFIQDIFYRNESVANDLLMKAIAFSRRQKMQSISMTLLEQSEVISILEPLGFRLRPGQSNMFSYSASEQFKDKIKDPSQWLIHVGDRDV